VCGIHIAIHAIVMLYTCSVLKTDSMAYLVKELVGEALRIFTIL